MGSNVIAGVRVIGYFFLVFCFKMGIVLRMWGFCAFSFKF